MPITLSGIFNVSPIPIYENWFKNSNPFKLFKMHMFNLPTIVIIHATKYDNDPIHTMHIRNVKGNKFLNRFFSQFGIVKKKRAITLKKKNKI